MKTLLRLLVLTALALAFTGCANISGKIEQFRALGVTEATITGKFSNTDYKVTELEDGTRQATLEHSNAWLPKVHVVIETPPKE